ncbi:hypothetical protein BUALT_Bualt18G0082600 [Buddleja alternifolia]|uniref:F-box domain-containing protein n=1 Tax=Buddleja alternifolia TaxID=168488 RepID=A0AAV6W5A8_9LAMI|nr:hypothetical protein BUALT_Bualt18G0082600 [Buddleja alternifolia]
MVESLMELPPNNIEQILSKLPIKSILACRCACKTLLNLTSSSNPHFHRSALFKRLPKSHLSIRLLARGLLFFTAETVLVRQCSLVCNPITKEYVRVPEVLYQKTTTSGLWLGFSPNSRVYKLCLHKWNWILDLSIRSSMKYFIVFFDFESEIFGKIDAPPGFEEITLQFRDSLTIGIVGDLLCLIDSTESLDIWVLNKCGSWNKQFSIDAVEKPPSEPPLRPLQLLSSGEMLMVSDNHNLVCYDLKRNKFKLINLHMKRDIFSVVTFVPSFVSLNDALMIRGVNSLNKIQRGCY